MGGCLLQTDSLFCYPPPLSLSLSSISVFFSNPTIPIWFDHCLELGERNKGREGERKERKCTQVCFMGRSWGWDGVCIWRLEQWESQANCGSSTRRAAQRISQQTLTKRGSHKHGCWISALSLPSLHLFRDILSSFCCQACGAATFSDQRKIF